MKVDDIKKDSTVLLVDQFYIAETLVSFNMGRKFELHKAEVEVSANFPKEGIRIARITHPTYGVLCLIEAPDDYRECLTPRNLNTILALYATSANRESSKEVRKDLINKKVNYGVLEESQSDNVLECLFYTLSRYKYYLDRVGEVIAFKPELEELTRKELGKENKKEIIMERRTSIKLTPLHRSSQHHTLPVTVYFYSYKSTHALSAGTIQSREDINP